MRFCLILILTLILFLPGLAASTHSYGPPLPSVEAGALISHLLLNIAIVLYVLAAGLISVLFIRKNKLVIAGRHIILAALVLHAAGYLLRWKELYDYGWGRFPLTSFYEALIFSTLMLSSTFFFLMVRSQREIVALFFLPIVIAILLFANYALPSGISALYDSEYSYNIDSLYFALRFEILKLLLLSMGYCLFTLAGLAALMQVVARMPARIPRIPSLFPSSETLYDWNKKATIAGTIIFTLGFAVSLFWAKVAWGVYWSWAPDEMLLAITLITYSIFMIRNIWQGWHTNKSAHRSLIGLGVIVITYLAAKHFLRGI